MDRPPPRTRRPRATFRPNFLLLVAYLGAFTALFGLLFALTDLVEGARALPPGPDELTQAELDAAREVAREALSGGRIVLAFVAAGAAVAAGVFTRTLPGFRNPR